jgi:two-component system NtrC family sensor kinase
MKNELLKYRILFILLFIIIASIFTVLYLQTINQEYATMEKLALEQARASYNKDLAYRRWAAEIGGVYVKVNDSLRPNPYLNVHNREITSTDGETYTLVNPAYMTRMVHELAWEQYKMKGHITSLRAINPNNEPDEWEKKALEMFEQGKQDYYSIENDQGETYLRYMGAMVTENACLKCHGYQGYKTGDIRGGISVSVPMNEYEQIYRADIIKHTIMFGAFLLFSVVLFFIVYRVISKEVKKRGRMQITELENAERHKKIIQSAIDGFVMVTKDGRITDVNQAYCEMTGYSKKELLNMSISELDYIENNKEVEGHIKKVNEKGKDRFESLHAKKDGSLINVEVSAIPQPYDESITVAFIKNITEQKNAEEALIESEKKYRHLVDNIYGLVCELDENDIYTYVNNRYIEILGYTPDELIGKPAIDLIHPDDLAASLEKYEKLKEEAKRSIDVWRFKHKNGEYRLIESRGIVYNKPDGKVRTVVVSRDITEQKKTENGLIESEKKFRQLFENINEAFALHKIIKDDNEAVIDYEFIDVNPKFEELTGLKKENLIGKSVLEVLPGTEKYWIERYGKVATTGEPVEFSNFSQELNKFYHVKAYSPEKDYFAVTFSDITEKKLTELALEESEVKYRNLFEKSTDGIFIYEPDTKNIIEANKATAKIYGYQHSELIGMSVLKFSAEVNESANAIKTIKKEGSIEVPLRWHKKKTGEIFPVNIIGSETIIGGKKAMFAVSKDLTELTKAETALRESEKRYRRIIEGANDAIFIADVTNGLIVDANAKAEELIGLTRKEIIGMHHRELHPKEVEEKVKRSFTKNSQSEKPIMHETYVQNISGVKIPVEISPARVNFDDGKEYLIGFFRNISERKKAGEKLKESEHRYRNIYNKTPVMLHSIDEKGKLINVSNYWLETMGYERDEVIGKKSTDFLTNKSKKDASDTYLPEFFEKGFIRNVPYKYLKKNGETIDVLLSAVTERDEKSNAIKSLAVSIDVTELKRTEEELKQAKNRVEESEKKYRDLVETAQELIWKCDSKGRYIYLNHAWEDILGYGLDEMLGKSFGDFQTEEDFQRDMSAFTRLMEGGSIKDYETTHIAKDGSNLILLFNAIHVTDDEGNVIGTQGTATDITQRKKYEQELEKHQTHLEQLVKERTDELEVSNEELKATNDELYKQRDELEQTIKKLNEAQAQLVQSEKMASLGVLVAGVAHEINNPVNFINSSLNGLKNNLDYLLSFTDLYLQLSEDNLEVIKEIQDRQKEASLSDVLEMFKRSIEIIEVGIERTTKIVKSLKSFARSDEKELSRYDVNENIDNTLLILYNQYKNRIEIIKEYEKLPLIVCYPGQINQVIMNILTNAIQAIKEKGFITINTKMIDNENVAISIKDTGTGIAKNNLKHIFDPFFTTKDIGKGTGLGLSISYNIIKEHKGTITVNSEEGKGSCFTVIIPIKQEILI